MRRSLVRAYAHKNPIAGPITPTGAVGVASTSGKATLRPIGTVPVYVDAGGVCYADQDDLTSLRSLLQGEENELVIGEVETLDLTREELEERVVALQAQVEELTTKLALAPHWPT